MTNQIQRAELKNANWSLGFGIDLKFEIWILTFCQLFILRSLGEGGSPTTYNLQPNKLIS